MNLFSKMEIQICLSDFDRASMYSSCTQTASRARFYSENSESKYKEQFFNAVVTW